VRPVAVPPFRALDPALAAAEGALGTSLSTVVDALPDESLATVRLNVLLADARLRLVRARSGSGWQVAWVGASGRVDSVSTAAGGLAALVAVAGWSRVKRCELCAEPFVDRTNGRTRRWCTTHRPHGPRRELSTTH
jgi:predicted RNA-binding Zn ribbon-like protein